MWMALGAALLILLGSAAGLAVMYSGIYNVAASSGHSAPVFWALEEGMRASVRRRSKDIRVPNLNDSALLRLGAHCYHVNCAQCHGAPGLSPSEIGKGMYPVPNSLTQTARDWPIEQIYWVTRHGIRTTGMPAWEFRLAERDLWGIAGFVQRRLPYLTTSEYREVVRQASGERCSKPADVKTPEATRGLTTMRQYGCDGCHIIPGIAGSEVFVGPPLEGFARRPLIAGVVPNTRENLIRWLREPQAIRQRTTMPDLGVTAQHAADIAAYLGTLE